VPAPCGSAEGPERRRLDENTTSVVKGRGNVPVVSPPREALLRVVREVVAPLVRADGGQVYLVDATDERISLHLGGRYAGCPGNTLARRRVIEPVLRAAAPSADISVTSGAIVPPGAEPVA